MAFVKICTIYSNPWSFTSKTQGPLTPDSYRATEVSDEDTMMMLTMSAGHVDNMVPVPMFTVM